MSTKRAPWLGLLLVPVAALAIVVAIDRTFYAHSTRACAALEKLYCST